MKIKQQMKAEVFDESLYPLQDLRPSALRA